MHSNLRHQSHLFAPVAATQAIHPAALAHPAKKQKMTITQTYFLAHAARGKLSHEASRGDHDLRLLVGHANLLDALTIELQDAEREQEAWFNETVKASRKQEENKRVQWIDSVAKAQEDTEIPDASDSEEDSDSEDGEFEDIQMTVAPRRLRSPPLPATIEEEEEELQDDDMYLDDEENMAELSLTRTQSHSASPPELVSDNSDDSDDEMTSPLSPPAAITMSEAQAQGIKTNDFATVKSKPIQHIPTVVDHHSEAPLVAAY